ncbi:hypothetical protein G7Y89_g3497 [Cudoniella acicularis]|uniref:C2H2-type domain-containing protein n=1 Tax=Cudoniella acicularis TaxID=354080 RepID=A0A8H4RT36_9HELO|nr:hypothetical protein G7Y89_g3497 [Cudoniella acicularis]
MAKRSREDFETVSESENLEARSTSFPHFTSKIVSSAAKILQYDPDSGENSLPVEMKCSLPPHGETLSFPSHEAFEIHYNKSHLNRCLECRRNFPTEHFLNLHIEENHDSLVVVRRERGEQTYGCFVEDCERKCSTADKRRMHLIDKHLFPKDYDFAVVNHGIDHRSSMLRSGRYRRRSSAAQNLMDSEERARKHSSTLETIVGKEGNFGNGEGDAENFKTSQHSSSTLADTDMDGLVGAMSALKFVPPSVRFGRGRGQGRGGFSRS